MCWSAITQDSKPREDINGTPTPITNAAIAYVQDRGSPEQNIPARPFMVPGIESVDQKVVASMEAVGLAALDGDTQGIDQGLHATGQIAKQGIQRKIVDGPFAPLADSTLKARAHRGGSTGKAAQQELDRRAAGEDPGVDLARPLNYTGQLHDAVQYALRNAK
jgi:hypothetical protein